jgi:hypothetical protein
LLLALLALSLVLLATLLAATTSALGIGKIACSQQGCGDRHGRCRSFPQISVHLQRLPFNSAAERGMQEAIWQLPFQSSNINKPYGLLNETKRFDSAVDDIGWRFVSIAFSNDCD